MKGGGGGGEFAPAIFGGCGCGVGGGEALPSELLGIFATSYIFFSHPSQFLIDEYIIYSS